MNIIKREANSEHYAAHLKNLGTSLSWSQIGCTHVLLVRGTFNTPIDFDRDAIATLQSLDPRDMERLLDGRVVEPDGGFALQLLRDGQVPAQPVPHSRYAAYGCVVDGDTLAVYESDENYGAQRDIPAKVHVTRRPVIQVVSSGFLGLKKTETVVGYSLEIDKIAGYQSGLYYRFAGLNEDWAYPITPQMLGTRVMVPVFAKGAVEPPEIGGDEKGYTITVSDAR